jgi:hypothetical protein
MSKHEVDQQIREIALRQAGAFSVDQAAGAGADRSVRHRRVRSGAWSRPVRQVFCLRDHPITWHTRLWIAVLQADCRVAVSHRSAAQLLGIPGRWADPVEVTIKEGSDHHITEGRLHQSSWLPPEHIVDVDGLPCTTVARTVFDLAGDPNPWERGSEAGMAIHEKRTRRLMNHALRQGGLTIDDETVVLAALAKRGRSGTTIMRRLLAEFGPDHVPTESGLEELFLSVVAAAGLEPPVKQVNLGTNEAFTGRVDFVYRDARLVIEVDSRWHDGPDDREADRWRDNTLHAEGWRVIRVRYRDLVRAPDRVVAVIRRALRTAVAA